MGELTLDFHLSRFFSKRQTFENKKQCCFFLGQLADNDELNLSSKNQGPAHRGNPHFRRPRMNVLEGKLFLKNFLFWLC